ncbi:hypothetical protein ACLB2K_040812 [Fragaria x ananassa]
MSKYEWDENDVPMFNWILKKAQERYKDWKYQCHKAYLKEGPYDMPSYFIGREDQWKFLCEHFESDALKRLSLANKRNRGEKTMHHHTRSSPIIYTMEELRIHGEQLPIIKGIVKTKFGVLLLCATGRAVEFGVLLVGQLNYSEGVMCYCYAKFGVL